MKRNSASDLQFPAFYRHDLLAWRKDQMGLSIQKMAKATRQPYETVRKVLQGKSTNKSVYPVADFLGLDWMMVHNLELSSIDFRSAVRDGDSER